MYSLARIIQVMIWGGGWIDVCKKRILRDSYRILEDTVFCETRDEDSKIILIDPKSPNLIRIPNIGAARYLKFFVKKNNISDKLLEEYGVLDYMNKEYPLFEDKRKSNCFPIEEQYFCRQVSQLADDYEIDIPSISEYAMDEVLKWCSDNGIEVINDYHRSL